MTELEKAAETHATKQSKRYVNGHLVSEQSIVDPDMKDSFISGAQYEQKRAEMVFVVMTNFLKHVQDEMKNAEENDLRRVHLDISKLGEMWQALKDYEAGK